MKAGTLAFVVCLFGVSVCPLAFAEDETPAPAPQAGQETQAAPPAATSQPTLAAPAQPSAPVSSEEYQMNVDGILTFVQLDAFKKKVKGLLPKEAALYEHKVSRGAVEFVLEVPMKSAELQTLFADLAGETVTNVEFNGNQIKVQLR